MRISMKKASLLIAGSMVAVAGAISPGWAQTRDVERGAAERPAVGTTVEQTDAQGKPLRMGHPDGPVENQLNKGRAGANGR